MENIIQQKQQGGNHVFQERQFFFSLIKISIPVVLESLLDNAVHLVDGLMIAILISKRGLTILGTSQPFYNLVFFTYLAWSIFGTIVMARLIGKRDYERVQRFFIFQIFGAMMIGIIAWLGCLFFSKEIISFLYHSNYVSGQTRGEILQEGKKFLQIISFTFPFTGLTIISITSLYLSNIFIIPILISSLSLIGNVAGNYFFIKILGFGVEGSAYSTVIIRLIEWILILTFLIWKKPRFFNLNKLSIKFDKGFYQATKKMFPLILFNEIQLAISISAQFIIFFYFGGEIPYAAHVLNISIISIFYSIFSVCSITVPYFVGKSLGKKREILAKIQADRILKYFLILSILTGIFCLLSAQLVPRIKNINRQTAELSRYFISWQSLSISWQLISTLFYSLFRTGGKIKFIIPLNAALTWILTVICPIIVFMVLENILFFSPISASKIVISFISLAEGLISLTFFILYKKTKWTGKII